MNNLSDLLLHIPGVARVECYDSLPSTNTHARTLADKGAPLGTVVIAREQTAGRGRFDRRFVSPEGGIYLSYIFRGDPAAAPHLTTCAAVAVAEAIESLVNADVKIKWVNDLWLNEKKICGILSEAAWTPDGDLDFAVIGIGVNVHASPLPDSLAAIATSIEAETAVRLEIHALTCAIVKRLGERLASLGAHYPAYAARSALNGKLVTISRGEDTYSATVRGIGEEGELLLTLTDGTETTLSSGEVVSVRTC